MSDRVKKNCNLTNCPESASSLKTSANSKKTSPHTSKYPYFFHITLKPFVKKILRKQLLKLAMSFILPEALPTKNLSRQFPYKTEPNLTCPEACNIVRKIWDFLKTLRMHLQQIVTDVLRLEEKL